MSAAQGMVVFPVSEMSAGDDLTEIAELESAIMSMTDSISAAISRTTLPMDGPEFRLRLSAALAILSGIVSGAEVGDALNRWRRARTKIHKILRR